MRNRRVRNSTQEIEPGDYIYWKQTWHCGDGCCSDYSYKQGRVTEVCGSSVRVLVDDWTEQIDLVYDEIEVTEVEKA